MSEGIRIVSLVDDPRPIESVEFDDPEGSRWKVGESGITEISPYYENGGMAPVPWLAIFKGDEIYSRVMAGKVSIMYEETGR